MIQNHNIPLSNIQLELLKLYSTDISDEDLLQIKQMIAHYFAQKAIAAADKVWDDNEWTNEDAMRMVNAHFRTPYNPR